MRPVLFTAFGLALLLPLAASAQLEGAIGDTSPFTLSVSPQYPAPYSQASISAQSNSLDLANATMTISVGSSKIYQGNVQPTAITLGRAGSVTQVEVTLVTNGKNYSQTVRIQPQDVSLIAEPISSAPPLYPGKPLVPLEGSTRIVAVANVRNANNSAINPATLSYAWTVDDTQISSSSGIGKMAVMVASPIQYRARTVSVAVTSQDGGLVGGAVLSLSPQEPSVRIYENDPLLGLRFDRALSNAFAITGAESTLYAAPFSLSTTSGAPLLRWFVNGSAAQTGTSITLRPSGSGEGSASLSLTASSGGQTATTNLSLIFGAPASSNFFGL